MVVHMTRDTVRAAAEVLLRPYAQILLSRNLTTGAFVFAAVACYPRLALATLAAVAVAAVTTALLGMGTRALREGAHGCTAVLTTLALGAFAPDGGAPAELVVFGAVLSVLVTTAFDAVFSTLALPPHSLPFVLTTWTVHLAARFLPAEPVRSWQSPIPILPPGWVNEGSWLDFPAAVTFLHGAAPGLLVLIALALHSRIGLALGTIGALASAGVHLLLRGPSPWSAVDVTAGFNATLTAIALGGLWFVPHPTATLLAGVAAAIATVTTYAWFGATSAAGLPVLSLPFGLVVILFLASARRRLSDRAPRSAVPAGTPEETLRKALAEGRLTGAHGSTILRLPFRGRWYVCQGNDGSHTHRDLWRHGFDFESRGPDGRAHERDGHELHDYYAYGLPVLSAAPGTVVRVVDRIVDNRPGTMDVENNWGNAVVIAHGPALYSVYAHLAPGTLRVKTGDVVATGTELGKCGNSGRSATPHLHFQMQRTPDLGAPTIVAGFCHVVSDHKAGEEYSPFLVPREGQSVRSIVSDDSAARALGFVPGRVLILHDEQRKHSERIAVSVDLFGATVLSAERAEVVLDMYDWGLFVREFRGDKSSGLFVLAHVLARVPFDGTQKIHWSDRIPRGFGLPRWASPLWDLVVWLLPALGNAQISFELERKTTSITIRGRSETWSSEATLSLSRQPHRLTLARGTPSRVLSLAPEPPTAPAAILKVEGGGELSRRRTAMSPMDPANREQGLSLGKGFDLS